MGVLIRPAGPDDADVIRAMIGEVAATTGRDRENVLTTDDIRRYGFGADKAFDALIAEAAGAAVGLVVFFPEFSTWRGRRGVYVQDLYVAPERRGEGAGRALLAAAAAHGARSGAAYLRLSADAGAADAHKFYRRAGFREMHEDRVFMLDGGAFDALAHERP